ncbi:MAG: hypothetical protein M1118_09415 [Chloroflexi bacterium]|nr:hypothetical protein [Chloroflexota bacterium]
MSNDQGIPFWSTFEAWGGAAVLGYPISGRFIAGGYVEQATQRVILQWQPQQHAVDFINVLDLLHDAGRDAWLQATYQIPPPLPEAALPLPGSSSVQRHLALLDTVPALRAAYFKVQNPIALYGLPTSGPADFGPVVVIRCQRTALQLWKVTTPWSRPGAVTTVAVGDIAKAAGLIPSAAATPGPPPVVDGQAATLPWSGWWWPASVDPYQPPYLFEMGGPLAKYDAYVVARGGANPHVRTWEQEHIHFDRSQLFWAGHCNGWAAAALLEPQPTRSVTAAGITFTVADQKGLLSDYHFADNPLWIYGSFSKALNPADLQRMVLEWLGKRHLGFIIDDIASNEQVESFPVYRFRMVYAPDPENPAVTHVQLTLWMADYHVNANIVGLKPYPGPQGQEFDYYITGPLASPTGGGWEGRSRAGPRGHPQLIWYPNPLVRNAGRQLTDPALAYSTILNILGRAGTLLPQQ